jgi:segregation and condensation protein B
MMDEGQLVRSIEALLFVSDEPLSTAVISQALEVDANLVGAGCRALQRNLDDRGAGVVLREVAGGWRLFTHPDAAEAVEKFVISSRQARLSKASVETLAIVAYKQPVTRHQISSIRGVNSDGVLKALIDRGILQEVGREDTPGRPVLYGTTPAFLERLGLESLASLPPLAPLLGATQDELEDEPPPKVIEDDTPARVGPPGGPGDPQELSE